MYVHGQNPPQSPPPLCVSTQSPHPQLPTHNYSILGLLAWYRSLWNRCYVLTPAKASCFWPPPPDFGCFPSPLIWKHTDRTFHGSFFFLFNHFLTTPDIQWFKHVVWTPQRSLPQPCLSKWDAPTMKDGKPFPLRSGKYTRLKIHLQKIPHEAEKAAPQ